MKNAIRKLRSAADVRVCAIHEAGHAVVVNALGAAVDWLEVNGLRTDGGIAGEVATNIGEILGVADRAACLLAGPIAETMAHEGYVHPPRWAKDFLDASEMIEREMPSRESAIRLLDRAAAMARSILVERWAEVLRVADALAERLFLNHNEFAALLTDSPSPKRRKGKR